MAEGYSATLYPAQRMGKGSRGGHRSYDHLALVAESTILWAFQKLVGASKKGNGKLPKPVITAVTSALEQEARVTHVPRSNGINQ